MLVDVLFFGSQGQGSDRDTVSYHCHEFLGQHRASASLQESRVFTEEMQRELKKCADIMADADDKMQNLANVSGIVQPIE